MTPPPPHSSACPMNNIWLAILELLKISKVELFQVELSGCLILLVLFVD